MITCSSSTTAHRRSSRLTLRTLIIAVVLVFAGCQTPSPATKATATPVSTTVADTPAAVPRFTQDIWPAVAGYNKDPAQGNPGGVNPAYRRYVAVVDKSLDTDAWGKLRAAVEHLGVVRDADETQGGSMRDEAGLQLANTRLISETPTGATLTICYTFTALSHRADQPVRTHTTSEATVELRKSDAWYLHAIANDHVVPSCSSNGA